MIPYFTSVSLNALIKNEMVFSNPSTFFYNKTVAIVSNETKEKTKIYLE
jgi:hypothetical protein